MQPISPPTNDKKKIRLQTGDGGPLGLWVSIPAPPHTQALGIRYCPGDGVQGVGCCPRSSDHRLAVTGGCSSRSIVDLCAPSSMLFCLLGASRQREARLPQSGARVHHPPETFFPSNLRGNAISFCCCSLFSYKSKLIFQVFLQRGVLRRKSSASCPHRIRCSSALWCVISLFPSQNFYHRNSSLIANIFLSPWQWREPANKPIGVWSQKCPRPWGSHSLHLPQIGKSQQLEVPPLLYNIGKAPPAPKTNKIKTALATT